MRRYIARMWITNIVLQVVIQIPFYFLRYMQVGTSVHSQGEAFAFVRFLFSRLHHQMLKYSKIISNCFAVVYKIYIFEFSLMIGLAFLAVTIPGPYQLRPDSE